MAKAGAIYVLLAVAFLLFLSLSPSPKHAPKRRRHNRRLAHLPHVAFDPLLAELERRVEEGGLLDVESFKRKLEEMKDRSKVDGGGDVVINIEDYFGQNGRLNLTERLAYLFPMLDRFPHDGGISHHELEVWFQRQAVDRLVHRTQRQMAQRDGDGDGELTLQELETEHGSTSSLFWDTNDPGSSASLEEQFSNADSDANGYLNAFEFKGFLFPEDSLNPKIKLWLLKEKLREMDQNEDGKLDMKEFGDRAYQIFRTYSEYDDEHLQRQPANVGEEFKRLDIDEDDFLTAEELRPIFHQLCPGELSHTTHYANYLMRKADENRDGKLTLEEMIRQQFAFYSSVYEELEDENDDYDVYDHHDELRR
ncbi:calumenin-like [Zingiber officinale]|uniref:calumenin-like n=1 Tax=Zingiber officinale TaxID=94328 RepID=UPI001C4D5BD6|nr:calumenin-like [Zingiber officinale]